MRWKGVHHVEFSVLDYDNSIEFYDAMSGWLGYTSFSTLDIEYRSTYYMARYPIPHSYIGIQSAFTGEKLRHCDQATGINHIALRAKSRREIDDFHQQFLLKRAITVTDKPQLHPTYTPSYYAVFFDDPLSGIHWELAHTPSIPTPVAYWRWRQNLKQIGSKHPEWDKPVWQEALRPLPGRH